MEISEAREFLKNNHRGCLVTGKKDGSLQMTLVSPVLGADGNVIITAETRLTRSKISNASRKFLCWWTARSSTAPITSRSTARPKLSRIPKPWISFWTGIGRFRGEPKSWQEIREKTLAEGRIAIRVTIEKVGPQQRR
jgi:hypothetical protein